MRNGILCKSYLRGVDVARQTVKLCANLETNVRLLYNKITIAKSRLLRQLAIVSNIGVPKKFPRQ